MKIYILCDMEGISGIRYENQVMREHEAYSEGRELMMAEINAAVESCFAGGASEVIVCDTHCGGGQLRLAEMDKRAVYEIPSNNKMLPSLDSSFDGVVLLGHHAMAGTLDAFLDHTMDSSSWFEYRLNGEVMGEIGIEAAYAGQYDVPVIAVAGDYTTSIEAKNTLGNVETAVVKWGLGREAAKCLSIPCAYEAIDKAIRTALSQINLYKPFKPKLPAVVQLTYYRSDMADFAASKPEVKRVDARTVSININSMMDLRPF